MNLSKWNFSLTASSCLSTTPFTSASLSRTTPSLLAANASSDNAFVILSSSLSVGGRNFAFVSDLALLVIGDGMAEGSAGRALRFRRATDPFLASPPLLDPISEVAGTGWDEGLATGPRSEDGPELSMFWTTSTFSISLSILEFRLKSVESILPLYLATLSKTDELDVDVRVRSMLIKMSYRVYGRGLDAS
jgi:hypothetical protein